MSTQSDLLRNLKGGAQNQATNFAADLITGQKRGNKNATKSNTGGLQNFISEISGRNGLYRPTFFEVQITTLGDWDESRSFSLLCHQAAIPGVRVDTTSGLIYGIPYEVPTGVTFDPCWCSFYIDNAFNLPTVILKELNKRIEIADDKGQSGNVSWSPRYRDDPQHPLFNIDITTFSTDYMTTNMDNYNGSVADGLPVISKYSLKNAFIKTVQQTALDWSAKDNIASMAIEFSYEYFENTTAKPTPPKTVTPAKNPLNFASVIAANPILGTAYDAAKRTLQQNSIMNNPIVNQGSQFLP
jgi:hypothetical protein